MSALKQIRSLLAKSKTQGGLKFILRAVRDYFFIKLARLCLMPISARTDKDPFHLLFQKFVSMVNFIPGATLLEIGSRSRSGNIYTQGFNKEISYIGFDIMPGPNVTVTGDIHSLSKHLPENSIDALFSISVFEHLAMPWKAVLEINTVLKEGGLVYVATHPAWPLHDRPWDFFRYSSDGFRALFHRLTGFEIIEAQEGLPCRIFPLGKEPAMKGLEHLTHAYLGVSMIARKTGKPDPRLIWDIDLKEFLETHYPK